MYGHTSYRAREWINPLRPIGHTTLRVRNVVDATRFLGAWLRAGEGIGWLAAGTMPNSLYRMPLVYLSLTCVFCYSCSYLFVVCVFVFFFALIGAW